MSGEPCETNGHWRGDAAAFRQEMRAKIDRVMADMDRNNEETKKLQVSIATLSGQLHERFPAHDKAVAELKAELAKQDKEVWQALAKHKEEDRQYMQRQDARLNEFDAMKNQIKGMWAAISLVGTLAVGAIGKWLKANW